MAISDYINTDDPAGVLEAERQKALAAAIAQVNSTFDAERANIDANLELNSKQRGLAIADLAQQRGLDFRRQDDGTVQRGILRSGIYARDRAELENVYDRSFANTNMQYDQQVYALQQALATLDARRAAGIAGSQAEVDAQYLAIAEALASLGYLDPASVASTGGSPSPAPPAGDSTVAVPAPNPAPEPTPTPNPTTGQTVAPRPDTGTGAVTQYPIVDTNVSRGQDAWAARYQQQAEDYARRIYEKRSGDYAAPSDYQRLRETEFLSPNPTVRRATLN